MIDYFSPELALPLGHDHAVIVPGGSWAAPAQPRPCRSWLRLQSSGRGWWGEGASFRAQTSIISPSCDTRTLFLACRECLGSSPNHHTTRRRKWLLAMCFGQTIFIRDASSATRLESPHGDWHRCLCQYDNEERKDIWLVICSALWTFDPKRQWASPSDASEGTWSQLYIPAEKQNIGMTHCNKEMRHEKHSYPLAMDTNVFME